MTKYAVEPKDVERTFGEDEIIVSKTDAKGRITYANHVFLDVAGFRESEVLGQPHSIVRHPDMPRCVFKLLWDTLDAGKEIFAYVKNMAKGGEYYWVFAHVTPSFDGNGAVIGYHSNRRVPEPAALAKVEPLYAQLLAEENRHADRKVGMQAGFDMMVGLLQENNVDYDQFVHSL
jgi:PAS domain S-box-containing protein